MSTRGDRLRFRRVPLPAPDVIDALTVLTLIDAQQPAQPRVLEHVIDVANGAEHAVGEATQEGSMLFEDFVHERARTVDECGRTKDANSPSTSSRAQL